MTYSVAQTEYTPSIHLNGTTGQFSVVGKSYTENADAFFHPVLSWIEKHYLHSPAALTLVEMRLEYYNTSNIIGIIAMLRKLEPLAERGLTVILKWYYNELDTDVMETGMDIKDVSGLQVELIPYKD